MECKCGNTNNFNYYFMGYNLVIVCCKCQADYLEEDIDYDYWEDETSDTKGYQTLDRRTKKTKNLLGLHKDCE